MLRRELAASPRVGERPRTREVRDAIAARVDTLTRAMLRLLHASPQGVTRRGDPRGGAAARERGGGGALSTAADDAEGLEDLRAELAGLMERPVLRLAVTGSRTASRVERGGAVAS